MDLHAHLVKTEVIGYLAGDYDEAARSVHILHAFPGQGVPLDGTHVELDPASEVDLREQISARAWHVMGWYHSRPAGLPQGTAGGRGGPFRNEISFSG